MILNSKRSKKTVQTGNREVETRVIMLVESLANELNPRRRLKATPQSSLQRDLGFDSLGLSELMLRAEKEFKLRLPEDFIASLETPSDLIRQISDTGVILSKDIVRTPSRLPDAVIEAFPDEENTLTGVLDWHVQRHGDRPHILLSDGFSETESISYQALSESAIELAAAMQCSGLEPGDSVGIMLPTGREFFIAFFATLIAGGVAVPMYPPIRLSQLEEHLRRQAGILRNSKATLLFIPEEGKALANLLGAQIETLRVVSTVSNLLERTGTLAQVKRQTKDLAVLQYTSGSTGDPKGVMLTHANLLANIRAMGSAIDVTSKDVFVSWLPLYHDLGLIGAWLGSLYHAVPAIIMSPLRFIVRPESWLWAIHYNSATLSAAPNFAFELCVNKIDDSTIEGLDLSSLRMIANGAEPVSAITIHRFTERFKKYGYRPEAMTPVYGLAENSVGLAFSSHYQEPVIDRISREALSRFGSATPASAEDAFTRSFVSSGVPLADHQIRIVDTFGHEVAERQQGRLEFRGPSATSGYFRDAEKSKELIHDGWLDSADLAYIANGNVFITGRLKDIIIKGGRNIYPEEIEEAVGNIPEIRKGCVAVFASTDEASGTEQLIVVAESRTTDAEFRSQVESSVAETVFNVLGIPADRIVIVSAHAVPKTSSGKIRRSATRKLYESGNLGHPVRALWLQVLRLRLLAVKPRFRHLIKILAEHIYAAWWWIVLVLVGVIVWLTVLILPKSNWRWNITHTFARMALKLMRIPVVVSGSERLNDKNNVIVVNHSSYFDAMIMAAVLPGEPAFVAKKELSSQFIAGPFLRKLGTHFADRVVVQGGLKEVETFINDVLRGEQLVIFPEATFSRMPGLLPFRLGAFSIACAAGVPVLPVVVTGTRSILRAEQWFSRRAVVKVHVLKPLLPDGNDFAAAIQLRDAVRSSMLQQSGEPDRAEINVVFSDIEESQNTG